MNYRYNTSMLPRPDLLRVCLSCWRQIPSEFSRKILQHRFPASTTLTCNGQCGTRWTSMLAANTRQFSSTSNPEENDISNNPYFEKYKQKLKHMQYNNPEEFEAKLEELKEKLELDKQQPEEPPPQRTEPAPAPDIPGGPRTWPPKSLNEMLKIDLIKELHPEQIKQLWQEYHLARDCIFSVVPKEGYDDLMSKSKMYPNFIFPLPKRDGYEFYLCQFSGKDVYFTSLTMYQGISPVIAVTNCSFCLSLNTLKLMQANLIKENAPPCLTVAHFPELKEDKGIVLMAGEYDDKVINKDAALNLVKQMALYYGKEAGDRHNLLHTFHTRSDQFQYMDLVEQYKLDKEFLEDNPY